MPTGGDDERFLLSDEERSGDPHQRLLVSVEELRALLAPLSEADRRRVLELARSLNPRAQGSRSEARAERD
jgi:hypothetical protein